MPRALQIALMWTVALAWVANLVVGYFEPDRAQQAVNAAFMVVVAVLWRELRRSRPEGGEESPSEVLDEARRAVGDLLSGEERRPGDQRDEG